MSIVFSKNKEKRPHSSSNEPNTSFVKNVTSRVSGLLPSTITKWFSSPSSANANGSAAMADATDSSTEDEASDTPVITQPPAKRMRFSTPGMYNHYGPTDPNCSTSNVEITEIPYSPFSATQFAHSSRHTLTTPLRIPNEDHLMEKHENETTHIFKAQHTMSGIGQSIAYKRKSIFDTTSKDETVNACTKSSTSTVCDPKPRESSFKPRHIGSPFYPGQTRYGGAASSYINQPNIKQQSVAVVNESKSNDDTAISSSARRIMDLLESYSSPLMEARRIPQYTRPKNNNLNMSSDRFSPYANKTISYKTQELHVPNIATILKLKKKSRLMDTTNAARQIIASHSSASSCPTCTSIPKGNEAEKEQSNKMTTKVKLRLTRTNRGNQEDLDIATPVKLPTAVLQIDQDKLPKFSFGTPPISKVSATSTPKIVFPTAGKNITEVSTSKHETVTSNVFKFSNPVKVSSDTPNTGIPPKFIFDNPERLIDQKLESKRDDCSVVIGDVKEIVKTANKSNEWQCSDCWVKNKADANKCVCCGGKQPPNNDKCSNCKLVDSQPKKDKCANCEKLQVSHVLQASSPVTVKSTGQATIQPSKWKCEDCWVSNDDNALKCVCCGGHRAKKTGSAPVTATVTSNTATLSTTMNADWKCDDCWISNKSSVDKCAACGGAKPSAKRNSTTTVPTDTTSFFGSPSDTFKNIVKSQKSKKWECSSCLVRNDSEKDACACCGAEKESKKKISSSTFNFGTTANTSFKFGINATVPEAAIAKKPEIQSKLEFKQLKEPSETNNNVLSETPSFSFTLPTTKADVKIHTVKKSEEAPKMNFTFGIPKRMTPPAVVTNKLSGFIKDVEADKEKPQEVPSVDISSPVQEKPNSIGRSFMSPITKMDNGNMQSTSTSTMLNPLGIEAKTDTPSSPVTLPPKVNDAEKPKPTFTFGVKSNPNPQMFKNPPSTATTVNLFAMSSQTPTSQTTSAPSLFKPLESGTSTTSLFKQPDASTNVAPLFQKSEPTSKAATAPMFSFGNTGPSNPSQSAPPAGPSTPENPKFQFTFGSNTTPKTDPPALFKSPFGSTENNVNNTNSLGLNPGSSLGSNNILSTNSLVGGNGLPTLNGLTGITMAGSTMGTLSANSMPGNPLTAGGNSATNNSLGSTNGLSANPLSSGIALQPGSTLTGGTTGLFGNSMQKDNVWSSSNNAPPSTNPFVSNTATGSLQKPPTFTFGSSTPFNAANTPAFGNNAALPQQNIFGMGNQNNNIQPSLFSNTVQSQPTGNLFGSPQPASNPPPQIPMFGTPSIGAAPAFGTPNPSIPSFDAQPLTPAAAPAFNFGTSQSTGIFGFGQQQQHQQQQQQHQQQQLQQQQLQQQQLSQQIPQQTGVYSFGGAPVGAPHVQFSMGSGANTAVRRVRKAVRRNPQR